MAQSGDDLRISRMLLELALDLDAEAEAIEATNRLCEARSGKPSLREGTRQTVSTRSQAMTQSR
jgi:hypothetical protein